MHQSRVHKNKVELWESLKGKVVEILEETFASRRKDEKLYILWIKHYQKLMPHLIMLDFQLAIMAFPTGSTLATQASEAREVSKEMEVNSREVDININTETKK